MYSMAAQLQEKGLIMAMLTAFEASIIGFLARKPASSYDLVKIFQDNRFYWSGSPGAVYSAVHRLEKQDLIYCVDQERAKMYSPTEGGLKALEEFCKTPVDRSHVIVDPIALRIKLRASVLLKPKERLLFYEQQLGEMEAAAMYIRSKMVGIPPESISFRLAQLALTELDLEQAFITDLYHEIQKELNQ